MGAFVTSGAPIFVRGFAVAELYYWGAFFGGMLVAFAFFWWVRP